MEQPNKMEMLKDTIYQLYSKEGRSKNYISKLLGIDRKALSTKINEWEFPEAEPQHHFTPSMQKFVNRHRQYIKSQLDKNVSITDIAKTLKISRHTLSRTILQNDNILKKAHDDYITRLHSNARIAESVAMENSSLCYCIEEIQGEIWEPILGYSKYMVSNMGRVKRYTHSYKAYHLVEPSENKDTGRMYVMLYDGVTHKNLALARLVAHAFISGHDIEHNTVNHKNGNTQDNRAENLEWVSQSENNAHAYKELNRSKVRGKHCDFRVIRYCKKYEFKTVAAFARFIGKSETQARRYLDNPAQHNIELVK